MDIVLGTVKHYASRFLKDTLWRFVMFTADALHKASRRRLRVLACLIPIVLLLSPLALPQHPAAAHGEQVLIDGMPSVKQWYSLSCEYAAAASVTLFWRGELVGQDHFIREVPLDSNPHLGFRGNIHGDFGGIENYGVYAEPLVAVLEQHGYDATVFYGGADRLKAEIDQGHPVVVWITAGREERPVYKRVSEGRTFKLVPGEHTVVVYGYDAAGVYIMDVGNGGKYYTGWTSFIQRWNYFDQMSLLIHPRS